MFYMLNNTFEIDNNVYILFIVKHWNRIIIQLSRIKTYVDLLTSIILFVSLFKSHYY